MTTEPKRGRPRNPATDKAIKAAALELLAEVGFADLTYEAVARRAGASKPAIYRRFPTKGALVTAALSQALQVANPVVPDSGDPNADTKALLGNTIRALSETSFGAALTEVVAPARRDQQLAETLSVFLEERRELLRVILGRAAERGLLRSDVETGIDMLLGAIYFRHLVTRVDLSTTFVARTVDALIDRA